jgi:glycine/D-amino acid oxidase-like deaminating enzyme
MKAVIIGGGIGGLASTLALARPGTGLDRLNPPAAVSGRRAGNGAASCARG